MKITGISIVPPSAAGSNMSATPELLASCFAKYSRSNAGIESIFKSIDWESPDRSMDRIFKFVDYGHASIAGMTGGIPIAIDGISMYLAYKIFEIAQLCDGQESSTRYIRMDTSSLPDPDELGIPCTFHTAWYNYMEEAFRMYEVARGTADLLPMPSEINSKPVKVRNRMRRNYALDRARYFIPFATKTNAAYVMTARVWAETIRQLESLPQKEAQVCAAGLRGELVKYAPRLTSHSYKDTASVAQAELQLDLVSSYFNANNISTDRIPDQVFLKTERTCPDFIPRLLPSLNHSFKGKQNRYSTVGNDIKRIQIRAAWNNMAIAEIRDLNRHRSGYRHSSLIPVGFYYPDDICPKFTLDGVENKKLIDHLLLKKRKFLSRCFKQGHPDSYVYGLLLGTQTTYERSTQLDKFIYEIELRTGLGAHFRYAEHMRAAYEKLIDCIPGLDPYIQLGDAEPE